MTVRPATLEDAPGMARSHVASWRAAYAHLVPAEVLAGLSESDRATRWVEILTRATRGNLVAATDREIAGFVSFGPSRDDDARGTRTGELYAIYLHPDWWGRGLGRRLWRAAHQGLLVEEYDAFTLWVLEGNARARAFYERLGMSLDESTTADAHLFGLTLSEVRYRRTLG
jgi:ribosomal protein S18 acetylase RimI-like enzyme